MNPQVPQEIATLLNSRNSDTTPAKPLFIITAEQRVGKSTLAEWFSTCITDIGEKYVISDSVPSHTFVDFTARVQSDRSGFRRSDDTIALLDVSQLNDPRITVLDALKTIEEDMETRRQLADSNLEEYQQLPIKLLVLDEGMDFNKKLNGLPKKLADTCQIEKDYWSSFLSQLLSKAGRAKYIAFYISHSLTVTSTGAKGLSNLFNKQPTISLFRSIPYEYQELFNDVIIDNNERFGVFYPYGITANNVKYFVIPQYIPETKRVSGTDSGQSSGKTGWSGDEKTWSGAPESWSDCLKSWSDWLESWSDEGKSWADNFDIWSVPDLKLVGNAQNLHSTVGRVGNQSFTRWFYKPAYFPFLYTLNFALGDDDLGRERLKLYIESNHFEHSQGVSTNSSRLDNYAKFRRLLKDVEWVSKDEDTKTELTELKVRTPRIIEPQTPDAKPFGKPSDNATIEDRIERKAIDKAVDKVASTIVDNELNQPYRKLLEEKTRDVKLEAYREVFENFDNVARSRLTAMGVDAFLQQQRKATPITPPTIDELREQQEYELEQRRRQYRINREIALRQASAQIDADTAKTDSFWMPLFFVLLVGWFGLIFNGNAVSSFFSNGIRSVQNVQLAKPTPTPTEPRRLPICEQNPFTDEYTCYGEPPYPLPGVVHILPPRDSQP